MQQLADIITQPRQPTRPGFPDESDRPYPGREIIGPPPGPPDPDFDVPPGPPDPDYDEPERRHPDNE